MPRYESSRIQAEIDQGQGADLETGRETELDLLLQEGLDRGRDQETLVHEASQEMTREASLDHDLETDPDQEANLQIEKTEVGLEVDPDLAQGQDPTPNEDKKTPTKEQLTTR